MQIRIPSRRTSFSWAATMAAAAACLTTALSRGDDSASTAAEEWKHLAAQPTQPDFPQSWKGRQPAEDEVNAWLGPEGQRLFRLADEAKHFWEKYPTDANHTGALRIESAALYAAMRLRVEGAEAKLEEVDKLALAEPSVAVEDKLAIRMRQVEAHSSAKMQESPEAAARLYVEGARGLLKEFPGRPEPYAMLLEVSADDPGSRATVAEVANSDAPERIKTRAQGMLHRLDALGKPFELKFTAVDGREVDLEKMKGKMVLIDLWATWCGPCVAALPKVKETYDKLQKLDFEIVGISFDSDKEALEKFVHAKEIPWPQYFDGKGWENKLGKEYGVSSIPSMWLVDRKGILRDLHAEINLAEKVEAMAKE
jgi:thiol-disulfide isomerase/thioredoxin